MSSFGGSSTSRRASASAVEDASRKIVAPWPTWRAACAAIAAFAAPAMSARCVHAVGIAGALGVSRQRPRAAVHPLDQALARELLEVAVHRDRGDRVVAREVGDGHAAVALDALQDLRPAECGGQRVQTRSTNSLRVIETSSGRNSSIARTRWSA